MVSPATYSSSESGQCSWQVVHMRNTRSKWSNIQIITCIDNLHWLWYCNYWCQLREWNSCCSSYPRGESIIMIVIIVRYKSTSHCHWFSVSQFTYSIFHISSGLLIITNIKFVFHKVSVRIIFLMQAISLFITF